MEGALLSVSAATGMQDAAKAKAKPKGAVLEGVSGFTCPAHFS